MPLTAAETANELMQRYSKITTPTTINDIKFYGLNKSEYKELTGRRYLRDSFVNTVHVNLLAIDCYQIIIPCDPPEDTIYLIVERDWLLKICRISRISQDLVNVYIEYDTEKLIDYETIADKLLSLYKRCEGQGKFCVTLDQYRTVAGRQQLRESTINGISDALFERGFLQLEVYVDEPIEGYFLIMESSILIDRYNQVCTPLTAAETAKKLMCELEYSGYDDMFFLTKPEYRELTGRKHLHDSFIDLVHEELLEINGYQIVIPREYPETTLYVIVKEDQLLKICQESFVDSDYIFIEDPMDGLIDFETIIGKFLKLCKKYNNEVCFTFEQYRTITGRTRLSSSLIEHIGNALFEKGILQLELYADLPIGSLFLMLNSYELITECNTIDGAS